VPETSSAGVVLSALDDLMSFLKAILDGRYLRGVRYPQWFLRLVAVMGILGDARAPASGGGRHAAPRSAE